jgi:hypothetical protein
MPTPEQIEKLAEAMSQLLDDMGKDGQSVCLHAKARARIAYEPFWNPEDAEIHMSLDKAEQIVRECDRR